MRNNDDDAVSQAWNFRDVPKDVAMKAKILAAIRDMSVKQFMMSLVDEKWADMKKKGSLPE